MMREPSAIDLLNARLDEVADDVLSKQVGLLRDLIGCQTISSPEPTETFTCEATRALDLVEPELCALGFTTERWTTADGFPTLSSRCGSRTRENGATTPGG